MPAPSYATPADLVLYGVNAQALASTYTPAQQQTALDTSAQYIDSYLAGHLTLPLKSWGADIRRACAVLAAYDLMFSRGYNPADGADVLLKERHDDIVSWLKGISQGKIMPSVQDSSALASTDPGGGGAFTRQASVQYNSTPTGQSLSGAAPGVTQNAAGGYVVVGSPSLRGW